MGKSCLQASSFIFDWIFVKLAGNQNLGRVRIPAGSDQSLMSYLLLSAKQILKLTLSNMNTSKTSWPVLVNFMCINGVGERCIRFWGGLDQNYGCDSNQKLLLTLGKWCHHIFSVIFDRIFAKRMYLRQA